MNVCLSNVSSMAMEIKITGDKGLMYVGRGTEGVNSILFGI